MQDWRPFTLRQLVVRYKALEREFYRRQSHGLAIIAGCISGKHVSPDSLNPTVKSKPVELVGLQDWTREATRRPAEQRRLEKRD